MIEKRREKPSRTTLSLSPSESLFLSLSPFSSRLLPGCCHLLRRRRRRTERRRSGGAARRRRRAIAAVAAPAAAALAPSLTAVVVEAPLLRLGRHELRRRPADPERHAPDLEGRGGRGQGRVGDAHKGSGGGGGRRGGRRRRRRLFLGPLLLRRLFEGLEGLRGRGRRDPFLFGELPEGGSHEPVEGQGLCRGLGGGERRR